MKPQRRRPAAGPAAADPGGGLLDVSAAAVRARRGPRRLPSEPGRPLGWLLEDERTASGGRRRWLTVFLAGSECPFACVFCDLWQHTLAGPTPAGALPSQVVAAREAAARSSAAGGAATSAVEGVKLYNASNLFEPRAVPPGDDPALLAAVAPFERVLAECHPQWIGERAFAFARALAARGAVLEVALGLETVHPEALPRLGKAMTVERFDRAVEALHAAGCPVRAFVLVGAPYVPPAEAVEWAVRSVAHAARRGVEHVCLIPTRGGNGTLEALARRGEWVPPRLADLELALDRALAEVAGGIFPPCVTADLWDLDRFATCPACFAARRARLERIDRTGHSEPPVGCRQCGGTETR